MIKIILIGAGGLGKEIYNYLKSNINTKFNIIGILDDCEENYHNSNIPLDYLGKIDDYNFKKNELSIIAIGNANIRKKIYESLKEKCDFYTYIHPLSYIAEDVVIGAGTVVCPFCTVNSSSIVGENTLLNAYSSVGHDARVGKHSVLSPYSTLLGFAEVGDECFLATRVTVFPSVKVGTNVTVSAHTIVKKNYESNTIVYERPKIYKSEK